MDEQMNVYDAAARRGALAAEIRNRENDGWGVLHRAGNEVTLVHDVRPPWWMVIVEMVSGLAGFPARSNVQRWLTIEALKGGDLFGVTVGDIPKGWPRKRTWEVSDGPIVNRHQDTASH